MKKVFKNIMKLTKQVVASLAIQLRHGTKNPLVMGAADKVGLITVLGSKPLTWPINLGLNFHSFLKGVDYENIIDKNIPRNYDNG